ncbi:hypothetical protein [Sulfitobacter sp. R18_1]|uniref:hypothetical protein n=1 Tax=Sulfitobacter sp. R18_1 TaxID=2821104 RepID=UPI001ADC6671|nr:hypothetical protein [Sulfitobacter sp. R18_1]MBO9428811.1 hypothetical protein [Sulfitobacter sp. R18_1]
MLGNHTGLSPLTADDNIKSPALKAMAHLKVFKSVTERTAAIKRASAQIQSDDRYWAETFASRLTDEGVEATEAQLISLRAAAAVRDPEVATLLRETNAMGEDPYVGKVTKGIMAADESFSRKLRDNKIDSDQAWVRVALSHFFRRDPDSIFQMFVINAASQLVHKVWLGGVNGLARWAIERLDEMKVPDTAKGYLVVLDGMRSKGGWFLHDSTEDDIKIVDEAMDMYRKATGNEDDIAAQNSVAAAVYSLIFERRDAARAIGLMSALAKRVGHANWVLYGRTGDQGTYTQLIRIPSDDPAEARKIAQKMPEVTMQNDIRGLQEFLETNAPEESPQDA